MLDLLSLREVIIPLSTILGGGLGWFLTFISSSKQNANTTSLEFTKILIDERSSFIQNLANERSEHKHEIEELRSRLEKLECTKRDNTEYIEKLERNYKDLTERFTDLQITYTLLLEEIQQLRGD